MRQINNKSIRKGIALIMALFSLLSCIPGNVLAAALPVAETLPETTQATQASEETTAPIEETTAPVGETTAPTEETTVPTVPEETQAATEPVQSAEDTPDDTEPTPTVYYFDLYAGDIAISGDGSTTTLTGWRYDGQSAAQQFSYTVTGTDAIEVYVYQSNHQQDPTQTGFIDGVITLPDPARVDGWGEYITNNTNVEDVIAQWISKNRPFTTKRIQVTGKVNCSMVLDNLYSTYHQYGTGKTTGGVSFVTNNYSSSVLTLKLKGDNRLGNVFYYGKKNNKNQLIFQDYPDQASAGTLTVANVKKNSNENYWCAAIGGNDSGQDASDGITINGGVLFAGTNAKDDCTAIGGGGNAKVTIAGGTVYAYNFSCKSGYSKKGVKYIPAAAIGGGSSAQAICNPSEIIISGGKVYAQSVGGTAIGGGSSADNNGGDSTITITGGTVEAYSIPGTIDGQSVPAGVSIGGGTGYNKGGFAQLTVSSNAVVRTGSIGGGGFGDKENADNVAGIIGPAKVTVTGGDIRGQIVMEGTGSFLKMSGGTIDNKEHDGIDYSNCHFVKENGGAACVETGTVNISGTAVIRNATALSGGAIYLSNGTVTMENGTIEDCHADHGGAVCVAGGDFTISGGTVGGEGVGNTAQNGGAVYVDGGNVSISGGTISYNIATVNGGGIAVNDGNIIMSGGHVIQNQAQTGGGGGMYVSAPAGKAAAVKVFSGTLSNNSAQESGGAVAVVGHENSDITVLIGVNENHYTGEDRSLKYGFIHTDNTINYIHNSCPLIENNRTKDGGGAFFITAPSNSTTHLDIFCVEEAGNIAEGDVDPVQDNKQLSSFLLVEGGRAFISTAIDYNKYPGDNDLVHPKDDTSGKASITGSVHVVSGQLELFGSMDNPSFDDALTIDLQKEGDKYVDHRYSPSKIKISYHENFKGPDNVPDSTQTAFDLVSGEVHTIKSGLYVHPGYELMGYNTDPGAIFGITQDGWYTPTKEYTFYNPVDPNRPDGMVSGTVDHEKGIYCGDLTIYAVWRVNGYTMEFVPGVPSWSGSVDSILCEYDVEYALPENGFVNSGYVFDGWLYKGIKYQPNDLVMNMTTTHNETVTFVAQWKKCEHPQPSCSYSVSENTLSKTCNLCQMTGAATLSAQDVIYDGISHPATLVITCEENDFLVPVLSHSGIQLKYNATTGTCDPTETPVTAPESCINAGFYTATITEGGETVQVTFTIQKAPQNAPTCIPLYKLPDEQHKLTIYQLSDVAQRINPLSGAYVSYYLRYNDTQGEKTLVFPSDTLGSDDVIEYTLTTALVEYKVMAGYPETDNYLPSDHINAESSFLFVGNVYLQISPEEGIDYYLWEVENEGLQLFVSLESDQYQLIGDDYTFTKEITNGNTDYDADKNLKIVRTVKDEISKYIIDAETADTEVHIRVIIGGVKKVASISGAVMEKEYFSSFTPDDDTNITRDSAFTMLYQVTGFYKTDYQQPVLTFSPGLPRGSTIILRDRNDGSYWYYKATVTVDTLDIRAFKSMLDENVTYLADTVDLSLQFIVDFSRVGRSDLISAQAITCGMQLAKIPESSAEDLHAGAIVGLASVTASMTSPNNQPDSSLHHALDLDIHIGAAASKYDNRDLALVLVPQTQLPKDATIILHENGQNDTYWPNLDGNFIIPIGTYRNMDRSFELQLDSQMFPMGTTRYPMTATLYLSRSNAESAPLNGTKVSEDLFLGYASERTQTSIEVVTDSDKRVYKNDERIAVQVNTLPEQLDNRYIVTVQLHREMEDNQYGNTLLTPVISGSTYIFDLRNVYSGSYCVVATLKDAATDYVITEARYYFILQTA